METLITILVALLGGLGFLFMNERRKNIDLKSNIDLTDRENDSKIVDKEVESAQAQIEDLESEMEKPVEEAEEFWKDKLK